MLTAIGFALLALGAGYAALRVLGLAKCAASLGIVPGAGLAVTSVVATWSGLYGVPTPVAGVLILLGAASGLILLVADRQAIECAARGFVRERRSAALLFSAAVLAPIVGMGIAFAGVQAPLSPHDGAFHVETSDAFRRASGISSWYPPGVAALFGGVLQLVPWLDSAAGSYELGLGLTLVAPIAVFGLGIIVWRDLLAAGAAALCIALTHVFPYYPQIWSGWPQLLGILLVLGLWVCATQYLDRPSWRWALLAGALVGAMVLVHGTELYTSVIVLVILALANWRRLNWRRLAPDVIGGLAVAFVCALPYLPILLHWAGTGGAYQVGYEDGTALETGAKSASAGQLLAAFTVDALGVDLPIRIVLVVLGVIAAFKLRRAGVVLALTVVFFGFAATATYLNGVALVREVFAATYPWSLPYRHLTFASITLALLAGGGAVLGRGWWKRMLGRVRGVAARRRLDRLGRLLVVTWLLLATWALGFFLAIERAGDASFSGDDAAAMAWMRQNVEPGAAVVNDTFADAGIWAPYKAGVKILVYRSANDPATDPARALVLANVARLAQEPSAAAAACALNLRYVYRGAENAAWQVRLFPSLAELRASPALQQVFNQGDAAVFRIRPGC